MSRPARFDAFWLITVSGVIEQADDAVRWVQKIVAPALREAAEKGQLPLGLEVSARLLPGDEFEREARR